jgi:hypothetical protein
MFEHERSQFCGIVRGERFCRHQLGVESVTEHVASIEDVCHTAGHAGRKIGTNGTENDDSAAGHVLTPVEPHSFDDRGCTAVANRKALAGAAGHEEASAGSAVERCVSNQHRIGGHAVSPANGDSPAVKTLSDAVVRGSCECDLQPWHAKRSE